MRRRASHRAFGVNEWLALCPRVAVYFVVGMHAGGTSTTAAVQPRAAARSRGSPTEEMVNPDSTC